MVEAVRPVSLYVVAVRPLATAAPLRITVYVTPEVAEAAQLRSISLDEAAVAVRFAGAYGIARVLALAGAAGDDVPLALEASTT